MENKNANVYLFFLHYPLPGFFFILLERCENFRKWGSKWMLQYALSPLEAAKSNTLHL